MPAHPLCTIVAWVQQQQQQCYVLRTETTNEQRASGSPETTEEHSHDGIVEALQGQYLINDELGVKLHHILPLWLQLCDSLSSSIRR